LFVHIKFLQIFFFGFTTGRIVGSINNSKSRKNIVEKNAKRSVFMYYRLNKQDMS